MFYTFKSRDHDGVDILVNIDQIQYALPTLDGNTVLYFDSKNFTVISEKFEEFKKKVLGEPAQKQSVSAQKTETYDTSGYKDLEHYPADLPRLPTGYVDKRTTAYKEYMANHAMHVQV